MSSRAISGRPGGGKSAYAVKLLLRELLETQRPIVTNLPLRLENIVKYCLKKGRDDIEVYQRIQILDDDQVPDFWRYRGNGIEPLPPVSNAEYKNGVRPAFDRALPGGVAYFLDEVHDFLNARNWTKTGDGVLYYITKHRHLGDDVFWITQAIKNVDSQFRSVTQDYTYCRNFAKEKWKGFTKGKYFTATTYLAPLTWEQLRENTDFQEQEKFTVEPDIFNCYWTSKQKLAADTGKEAKGINIRWLLVGIGVLCVIAFFAIKSMPSLLIGGVQKSAERATGVSRDQIGSISGNKTAPPPPSGAPLKTPDLATPAGQPSFMLAVPLENSSASDILDAFPARQLSGVTLTPSASGSVIVASGSSLQSVAVASETLKALDASKSENVVIQCVVLRISSGRSSSLGVWGSLQEVISEGGFGLGEFSFDVATGLLSFGSITAAQEVIRILGSNDVTRYGFKVESRPSLSAASGQQAWFTSGREVPIPVTTQGNVNSQTSVSFKKVLFSLGVTPTVLPGGRIALRIEQTNDDIVGSAEVGGQPVPTIATQSLQTRVELQEGDLAVLGGIRVQNTGDQQSGLPLLHHVPGLNLLLGNRQKRDESSELVVCVTAYRSGSGSPRPQEKALTISQKGKPRAAEPLKNKKQEKKKGK